MDLNFIPPGPVAENFMKSMKSVNAIMGPVGSGKTSCLMMKTIQLAAMQPQSRIDGVRYTKALFVRETFRQLYGTTIPSWWAWMPKDTGTWKGGGNDAASHHIRFQLPDQTIVDLQVLFEALGEQNVETLFRGKEFNLLNLNEGDTLVPDVLSQGIVRVKQGRYPGEKHVSPRICVKQVNIDYNAPDIENYLYQIMEETRPEEYGFFRQPGGMEADAENRERATYEDYEEMERDLIAQGREDLARRMIHNVYGFTRDGKPVYHEYRDDFHCAGADLEAVPDLPIKVDLDQGLHPAAVLRQTLPNGQLRLLEELYCDSGAEGIADLVLRTMAERYPNHRLVGGICDMHANARSGNDAETWLDAVNRFLNFKGRDRVRPAQTDKPDKLTAGVRQRLNKLIDGGQPAFLMSARCRIMRKGFNSSYHFKKKVGSNNGYQDLPTKAKPVSDIMNAVEFACQADGGYEQVVGRAARSQSFMNSKTFTARENISI